MSRSRARSWHCVHLVPRRYPRGGVHRILLLIIGATQYRLPTGIRNPIWLLLLDLVHQRSLQPLVAAEGEISPRCQQRRISLWHAEDDVWGWKIPNARMYGYTRQIFYTA
jgi:hypothetical protein